MQECPLPVSVDAATVQVLAAALRILPLRKIHRGPITCWLVWPDTGPSEFLDEQTGNSQGDVMDDFSMHSEAALARQQTVIRISLVELRVAHRGLPIRTAGDYRSDDMLHIPRVRAIRLPLRLHEFGGKPVQQLKILRPLTLRAQITEYLGEPRSEELLPYTIDEHSRRERILM